MTRKEKYSDSSSVESIDRLRRVLIVSHSFPPLNNIAARRYGWMTAYMEQFGWKPYVLTAHSEGALAVNIPSNQVIRIGEHHQAKAKIDENYYKWKTDINPAINIIRNVSKTRLLSFDASVFGWYSVVRKNFENLMSQLPKLDFIIGSYKPSASHLIARKLSSRLNVPWIADFRDMGALRNFKSNRFIRWADIQVEKKIVGSASGVTSVSKQLTDGLSKTHGKPGRVIYNGFHDPSTISRDSSDDKEIYKSGKNYLHYAGRIGRDLLEPIEILLKSISELNDIEVVFRSLGPESQNRSIRSLSKQYDIDENVKILPPVSPEIVIEEQKYALANLVFVEVNQNSRWGIGELTGKFLQLLPGKVPVLSICRPDNEMTEILNATKRGKTCSTSDQVTEFLRQAKKDPGLFHGQDKEVNFYSTRSQAQNLCDFLDSMVAQL